MAEALVLSMMRKLERRQEISCLSFCKIPCFFKARNEKLEGEIKEETKAIIDELRMIVDILRDKKLGEGRRLNYFLCDLDEMAHDALDLYEWEEEYGYYSKIYSVRSWIGEIKRRMLRFGVDEAETTELSNIIRSEDVGEGNAEEDVVGLEEDVKLMLRKIISSWDDDLSTFLIKGMDGIGKTTLARQVYNNAEIISRFNRRAWVCVSTDLTVKEVLMKLIQQVVDCEEIERHCLLKKMECANNKTLQQMLRRHLQGMRYFIVLDDFPKQMRLESVLTGLPSEANGSRLLLTSHTTSHGIYIRDYNIHRMEFLNSKKSWQLFLKTIQTGTSEYEFPKHLERKGREMLRKCGGLPLAIKEVGRRLAEKRQSGSDWEQLLESFDLGETLEILESFYHKLERKLAFLHLAFFKENTIMRKENLEQIWDVEGVFKEIIPGYCLDSLLNESVIEIKDKRTRFCMNPILHRLSIKKAEEEIGLEILGNNGNNQPSQSSRHRIINCSREKCNYSTSHGNKHLVSLLFHGGGYFDDSPSYWKNFELLKILDLEDFGIKILPESIGTLMELRYLGLRNNYIQELPHTLGCLKKLEVLDIAQNFMVEVPDFIWEMDSLRHLYMSDVIFQMHVKIDTLKKLKTLNFISVDNWICEMSGLHNMFHFSKLGIEGVGENSDVSKLFASLAKLGSLRQLILKGFRFRSMPCLDELGILQNINELKLDGLLEKLPSTENFPPRLWYLTLVNTRLDEDPMIVLQKLPRLTRLKLRNAYTGEQMVMPRDSFPELKVLCIEEMWNLRNLQVDENAMRYIEKVEINNCPHLESFPREVGGIFVKEMKMVTTKSIATKIQKSGYGKSIRFGVDINP